LSKFTFNDYKDRQTSAAEARKALLERFKSRPDENDPVVASRRLERDAILKAREEREAIKAAERAVEEARLAVIRAEKEEREAAERAAKDAQLEVEKAAREAARSNLVKRAIMDQVDWKSARLAARKKR
jgi:membrane protein involved in colicin uptake